MADISKLLAEATRALVEGDNDGALRYLTQVEKQMTDRPALLDTTAESALRHLSELAYAAREGAADARAMILQAGGDARNLKTYDIHGDAQPVSTKRGALHRF
ncbi:MAG: hypothetical protein ACK5JT_16550 [Hyphomicrobiaceae bacterium]